MPQNLGFGADRSLTAAENGDMAVAIRSRVLTIILAIASLAASACKEGDAALPDAGPDDGGDASADVVPSSGRCQGVAPMGQCVWNRDGCCDDVIVTRQLECLNGQWACPAGQTTFNECCGVGFMCEPYPGGGQPPPPACASRCLQSEGRWFCGNVPDAGRD